jgi:hypothetical protein
MRYPFGSPRSIEQCVPTAAILVHPPLMAGKRDCQALRRGQRPC